MVATARAYSRNPPAYRSEQRPAPPIESRHLWLCAYFPDLALESMNLDPAQPSATLETIKGRPSLQSVSAAARRAGIEPGMSQAAALALCPALTIRLRDLEAERLALLRLADAGLHFSPWLSLDKPQCLLLEIRSCLRLFGGAVNLREQLRQALLGLNHRPVIAISPAQEASEILARQSLESLITDDQALRSTLAPLPISALLPDQKTVHRLQRTGILSIGDLCCLPRDGLARRYGASLLRQLDGLTGLKNPAVNGYRPPPSFHARKDMPAELERLEHFFPAIEQLAEEFSMFLLTRDVTALGLKLDMLHHDRPATRLELDFRTGSRDAGHWLGLLREKLERSPLPAPVLAIVLSSEAIAPFQPDRFTLFDDDYRADGEREWQSLLDQLQARLGHAALKHIALLDDHRPECAISEQASGLSETRVLAERPLWLLSKPQALDISGLKLHTETERIESGWWDGSPIRRDYRLAQDKRGRKLWVFRDLNGNAGWFLHGLFG